MSKKRKGSHIDRPSSAHGKDTNDFHIHQQIRNLFMKGGSYTASELNHICGGNDARKVISLLRNKELMNIRDVRLPDGRKRYWYSPESKKGGES